MADEVRTPQAHSLNVSILTLRQAVRVAQHVYRTTDDLLLRAQAANVLTALPAYLQAEPGPPEASDG